MIFVIQIWPWYPKLSCFLYCMNEKFNKNAKVEKFTNMLGIAVRLIIIDPLTYCSLVELHRRLKKQDVYVKHKCMPPVKNGLDLDPLTCRAIGIIFILMLISVPSLKSMGLKHSPAIGCRSCERRIYQHVQKFCWQIWRPFGQKYFLNFATMSINVIIPLFQPTLLQWFMSDIIFWVSCFFPNIFKLVQCKALPYIIHYFFKLNTLTRP